MSILQHKEIVLGVSGGIAAYKAAALTSKLTQAGAKVSVVLTANACRFVQPITFEALSHRPVYTDTFTEPVPGVISHIDVADRADLVILAPATANIIGKYANGIADDMLSTMLLATTAPVMVAPAMNVNMYNHPAVQANMQRLLSYGVTMVEPNEGMLACGWVGRGRLAEPEEIVEAAIRFFEQKEVTTKSVHVASHQDLQGKKIVVTAGPTREKIDPVRYISNYSSGKMGYAIAEAARDRGADVTLISGPTALSIPSGVTFVPVESVQEMLDAVLQVYPQADVVIKSAAVSDYRPELVYTHKVKKTESEDFSLSLVKAPDILRTLGEQKTHQMLVGFAAETQEVEKHALDKMRRKNLDMIVANDVLQEGAGMGVDTNIVTIYQQDQAPIRLDKMSKRDVAERLLDVMKQNLQAGVQES
ncbi:bifunctional phosphopantothenoylcysteine decarboxylase/phosphopantothenate--cysteine ligase CoaBC [Brevibacillus laterosporus]|uniref:bifunctional phosphopantothenoylcysteine decarboxylase/phosphopantothenate--cysteine ligase CoaBC n=1 Tax=Brevibacillus laterosporus TaxID=1465 RepID=UPI000CE4EFA2|nr:bifunctional phosphopantothenoylcysteine decarboxylase/phosphopantothenate--cysteine ligase CoaBC [Brevibacillus laterosporus]MED1667069.1 bifunctional phosphopantothenoylcysteine decarboxylase/phosphopantothenate--cysteine ligase CoaBC [Brevibacillus laterosporus]MED1671266.1 bifunctional phosphopantothenoylcysteine decarboxylase/phosphopantothenate--cysteine ligase CoaBC [Brevibacillus laterosporus]MED1720671.1 bifunctional phosphopantothenoylcysteine decarboxylase/phosphopantothenate--cyst